MINVFEGVQEIDGVNYCLFTNNGKEFEVKQLERALWNVNEGERKVHNNVMIVHTVNEQELANKGIVVDLYSTSNTTVEMEMRFGFKKYVGLTVEGVSELLKCIDIAREENFYDMVRNGDITEDEAEDEALEIKLVQKRRERKGLKYYGEGVSTKYYL